MLDTGRRFVRGFKPKWSDRVYKVSRINGAFVYDEDGQEYMTKLVQPVAGNPELLQPSRIERRGSAQTVNIQRPIMSDLADKVRRWIGDRTVTVLQLGSFLSQNGFKAMARDARINMKAPVVNFIRLFPDHFSLETEGGVKIIRSIKAQPAFEGARRLRRRI